INYYIFPHLDPAENKIYTEQLHVKNNKIYVILADQPHALTNEKQTNTSTSSSTSYMGGGYSMKTTTTHTETSQLFEIFHLTNVFVIDGNNGSAKKIDLSKEMKSFYSLGDTPALFTEDGIYIPGRL